MSCERASSRRPSLSRASAHFRCRRAQRGAYFSASANFAIAPAQQAEAALRRFVRDAAFSTRSETLTQGFAAALGRYAEGAEAAIYLLREEAATNAPTDW